jgi:cold-inducible RNA-binding protein
MSARVFVGNLHYETTKEELEALLSPAGSILDLHLPTDRESGRPRGFAFVGFSTEEQAAEAIRRFNQVEMRGRRLNLSVADDRPPRGSGPRPAGPRPVFDAGGPGGFGGDRRPERRFNRKGSRRGLRARKRSL